MAWTVKATGNVVNLTPAAENTDDFTYSNNTYPDLPPEGLIIKSVQVVFSAANDKVVIRDGSLTGPEMFNYTTLDGSSIEKKLYGGLFKPCLKHSDQTYGTPANWRIIFILG